MKIYKKIFGVNLVEGIIMMIFGLILLFKPEQTINLISNLIGCIVLLMGIFSIFKFLKFKTDLDIIYGIFTIVLGLILLLNPGTIISILPIIFGIYFIINGVSKLRYAIDIKKYNGKNYFIPLLISILIIACGVTFVVNPFKGAIYIVQVIGIFIIIYSSLNILNYFTIKKYIKDFKRGFYND